MRTIDLRVVGAAPSGHALTIERESADAHAATVDQHIDSSAPGQDIGDGC
jgi:hypothetical protein